MSLVLLGWIAACTAPSAGISQRAPVAESAVAQPQPAPAAPVAAPSPATPPNNPVQPVQPVSYPGADTGFRARSEEHTSELQSLMRTSNAVFYLKKKNQTKHTI